MQRRPAPSCENAHALGRGRNWLHGYSSAENSLGWFLRGTAQFCPVFPGNDGVAMGGQSITCTVTQMTFNSCYRYYLGYLKPLLEWKNGILYSLTTSLTQRQPLLNGSSCTSRLLSLMNYNSWRNRCRHVRRGCNACTCVPVGGQSKQSK